MKFIALIFALLLSVHSFGEEKSSDVGYPWELTSEKKEAELERLCSVISVSGDRIHSNH
jgi:hypothetical protein